MTSMIFLGVIFIPVVGFYAVFFVALCRDCVSITTHHFLGVKRGTNLHSVHQDALYTDASGSDDLARAA